MEKTHRKEREIMKEKLKNFGLKLATHIQSESGQGISEYLIILAVVVIAAIALATTFSDQLTNLWDSITSQLAAIS